jgi:hypothetical protein
MDPAGHRKALTQTGFAHRRWYWPRWQHALWRTRNSLAAALLAADLLFQFRRTLDYLAVTAAAGAGYGAWRGRSLAQGYAHRKNNIKPVHVRFAEYAGIPIANKPESWLDIPRDLSYAALTWPKGAQLPKPQDRQAIESGVASTLGMRCAKPSWQFTGPRLRLKLVPPVPPPKWTYLDDIVWASPRTPDLPPDAIRKAMLAASADEIILGIGQDGQIVKVNFRHDSPHMALSVDTGKGKSVLVRCLVSQVLLRGGIAALLDNKLVSHPSLRALKNVAYADDIEKIHKFLCWLDEELNRRAEFIRDHTDFVGVLRGDPGPRLFVILEEQNLLMNRLRSYWERRRSEDRSLPPDERENLRSPHLRLRASRTPPTSAASSRCIWCSSRSGSLPRPRVAARRARRCG